MKDDTNSRTTHPSRRGRPATSGPIFSRRSFLGAVGVTSVSALAGCIGSGNQNAEFEVDGDEEHYRTVASTYFAEAILYKAPSCSCCLEYADYLDEKTDATIETVEVDDLAETKDEYAVPRDVESCHTVDIGSYFVEGHVPLEAIGKLADDEPEILGIALPEMPTGSPGMPGEKSKEFVIYAVFADGSYEDFMTL